MGIRVRKANPEGDVVQACLMLLRLHGAFAWRNNSGALVAPAQDGRRRRFVKFNSEPGASDIIGVLACGALAAVECKAPGRLGDLKPHQASFLDEVRKRGGFAACVDSVERLAEELARFKPAGKAVAT